MKERKKRWCSCCTKGKHACLASCVCTRRSRSNKKKEPRKRGRVFQVKIEKRLILSALKGPCCVRNTLNNTHLRGMLSTPQTMHNLKLNIYYTHIRSGKGVGGRASARKHHRNAVCCARQLKKGSETTGQYLSKQTAVDHTLSRRQSSLAGPLSNLFLTLSRSLCPTYLPCRSSTTSRIGRR